MSTGYWFIPPPNFVLPDGRVVNWHMEDFKVGTMRFGEAGTEKERIFLFRSLPERVLQACKTRKFEPLVVDEYGEHYTGEQFKRLIERCWWEISSSGGE